MPKPNQSSTIWHLLLVHCSGHVFAGDALRCNLEVILHLFVVLPSLYNGFRVTLYLFGGVVLHLFPWTCTEDLFSNTSWPLITWHTLQIAVIALFKSASKYFAPSSNSHRHFVGHQWPSPLIIPLIRPTLGLERLDQQRKLPRHFTMGILWWWQVTRVTRAYTVYTQEGRCTWMQQLPW